MITVPATPAELDFPKKFATFRQQQTIAAMKIAKAFETTDNVILQAPPGVGKTLLAMLVARMCSDPRVTPPRGRNQLGTLITTMTKQLQDQYMGDFPDQIKSATGRDNWICDLTKETAATAPCTHGWSCPVKATCGYIKQRNVADASDVAILNTAFALYESQYAGLFRDHDLTIYDEAHQLEGSILSFAGQSMSARLAAHLPTPPPHSLDLSADGPWPNYWNRVHKGLAQELVTAEAQARLDIESGTPNLNPRQAHLIRDIKHLLDIETAFRIAFTDPTHWILTRDFSRNINLRSAWGYTSADKVLPKGKKLFMSATILSPELLAFQLSLPDYTYIEIDSDFPAAQRPIYYIPTIKMSARCTSDEYTHLVETIDALIQARHLGQKGIIHTVSYQLRDEILARSKWRALMVTHDATNRADQLKRFRDLPAGYILLSPSMTTGVDLPHDQCRWQMIPKLPFPNLGDPIIAKRKGDNRFIKWNGRQANVGDLSYAWATTTQIVQTYGRAMRDEKDWGYTYILDSNFWSFMSEQRWGPLFPDYVKEAVRYTSLDELGVEIVTS